MPSPSSLPRRAPPTSSRGGAPCNAASIGDVVAIGAAVPTSLTERVALPMGVRANLAQTLALGAFDVVHGFEPGLPSLSSAALLEAETTTAATFFSTERIAIAAAQEPAGEVPRTGRCAARHLGGGDRTRVGALSRRLPDDPARDRHGGFAPAAKQKLIVVELAPGQSAIARAVLRLLPTLPGWEVVLARTAPLTRRPSIPAAVRDRAHTRSLVKPEARRSTLAEAAIFVPAPGGSARLLLEAASCGCAIADPAGARRPARARSGVGGAARRGRRPPHRLGGEGPRAARGDATSTVLAQRARETLRAADEPPAAGAPARAPRRRPARRPRLDRRRPAHAHAPIARLLDRAAGAGRPRRGGRARRDRRHRPQRLRRRPRDGRARPAAKADRDSGRGGQDRQPGRGDRALPPARRSRAG